MKKNKKLAVCVPYRNRKEHLNKFVPYLTDFLTKKGVKHKIFICHQADNKLFNRGKTKNIAFKAACEEGYDYFAFHDIDLLPEDDSCDYSYPEQYPVHLAVRQSDHNYNLQYPEYFGGCVLFTREQFENINGYYNDYWGWGWEDDDLFYRIKRKGYADEQYLSNKIMNKSVLNIKGKKSYIKTENNLNDKNIDKNGFSLMMLVKPEVKTKKYLIGSKYSYFQVPIFNVGKNTIINYNKFEDYAANLGPSAFLYNRGSKNEWSIIFLTVDKEKKEMRFFVNGNESCGIDVKSPLIYKNHATELTGYPITIGNDKKCFSSKDIVIKKFKGQIGEICLWNKVFREQEIYDQNNNIESKLHKEKLIIWYDFEDLNNGFVKDKSRNKNNGKLINCNITKQYIGKIKKYSLPYRRNGKFYCLPHSKDFFRENHIVKQSYISALNEKILKLKVQTGKIDPNQYGINNLKYKLISKETIFNNHVMINVEC